MKRTKCSSINFFLFLLLGSCFFISCEKNEGAKSIPISPVAKGIYVLNEGLWQMNNSTLIFYDLNSCTTTDAFLAINHRGLGDTGSDLQKYGNKLYCVVNISETLEIMDLNTAKSLKKIDFPNRQPRKITFDGGYAYLCCFDGSVLKIDTSTFAITESARAGSNPDGICVANGKLYVSNSGGLNAPNYGNSVSVFDLTTLSYIKDIIVETNPTRIASDDEGDVYVVCNGNYGNIPMKFLRIDTQIDEVAETFPFAVSNFAISDSLAYLYHYNYSTQQYAVKVMNVHTDTIVNDNFIKNTNSIRTPYAIAVDHYTGDVFLTDALQYTTNGDVYCFDADGYLKYKFEAGVNPGAIVIK